jgi:hypothetical protein
VEDGEDLGLSSGEMLADEAGVESVVTIRRRAASAGKAVVVMVYSAVEERLICA